MKRRAEKFGRSLHPITPSKMQTPQHFLTDRRTHTGEPQMRNRACLFSHRTGTSPNISKLVKSLFHRGVSSNGVLKASDGSMCVWVTLDPVSSLSCLVKSKLGQQRMCVPEEYKVPKQGKLFQLWKVVEVKSSEEAD